MNHHGLGNLQSVHLGTVIDNADPDGRGQIKLKLLANELEIWASVVMPSAGEGYGMHCLPKIDEIVVIAFISPDTACVLGSIWAGQNSAPEEAEPVNERYVVKTPAGTLMEFKDDEGPSMQVTTPAGHVIRVSDAAGGEIEVTRGSQSIKLSSSEVNISGTRIVLDASTIQMSASMVDVSAAISQFSGVVQSDTAISSAVVGSSYTPGAGNVW